MSSISLDPSGRDMRRARDCRLSSQAAPDPATTRRQLQPRASMTHDRAPHAPRRRQGGLPALIAFVHLTAPIYQVTVVRRGRHGRRPQRARKDACTMVSARANTD